MGCEPNASNRRRNGLLKVRSKASTDARLFGGGVDGYEDEVGLLDALVDVGGEEQVLAPRLAHYILQARFIDRECKICRVPRIDAPLIEVDNSDLDMRAFQRYYRARWAA